MFLIILVKVWFLYGLMKWAMCYFDLYMKKTVWQQLHDSQTTWPDFLWWQRSWYLFYFPVCCGTDLLYPPPIFYSVIINTLHRLSPLSYPSKLLEKNDLFSGYTPLTAVYNNISSTLLCLRLVGITDLWEDSIHSKVPLLLKSYLEKIKYYICSFI